MAIVYTRQNFQDFIADPIPLANLSSTLTIQNSMNRAVRIVNSEVDIRSTKRRVALASKLFDDVYSYAAPSDLKVPAIIDFDPQANRQLDSRLVLVPEQRFHQKKTIRNNVVSIATDDNAIRILYSGEPDDTMLRIASFDSTTADGGTWTAYSDADTVAVDTDNKIQGAASIRFDLTGAATTAGISNTDVDDIDITNYRDNGSVFVWVYINSTTNLTNFILDIGNDLTTNYFTQTITTNASGTAFVNGWNLLRFDFASMTLNGTVASTTVDSIRLYMTKTSGKSDNGYRVDDMQLHTGEYFDVIYYSKYGWQTTANVFIENSTTSTDYINADTDELDLYVAKGKAEVFKDLRMWDEAKIYEAEYQELKKNYIKKNPSERVKVEDSYYNPTLYFRKF